MPLQREICSPVQVGGAFEDDGLCNKKTTLEISELQLRNVTDFISSMIHLVDRRCDILEF